MDEDRFTFEELAAIRRENFANRDPRGPQLTREGRCQVYACLLSGVKAAEICQVFDITQSTVSYIGGCRDHIYRPRVVDAAGYSEIIGRNPFPEKRRIQRHIRYQDVAAEFDRLGEDRFIQTYFTKGLAERCAAARRQLNPGRVFLRGM